MASKCNGGHAQKQTSRQVAVGGHLVDGVAVPYMSLQLLWRLFAACGQWSITFGTVGEVTAVIKLELLVPNDAAGSTRAAMGHTGSAGQASPPDLPILTPTRRGRDSIYSMYHMSSLPVFPLMLTTAQPIAPPAHALHPRECGNLETNVHTYSEIHQIRSGTRT